MKRVLDPYGPEEVLVYDYSGSTGLVNRRYPKRLFDAIGATSLHSAMKPGRRLLSSTMDPATALFPMT